MFGENITYVTESQFFPVYEKLLQLNRYNKTHKQMEKRAKGLNRHFSKEGQLLSIIFPPFVVKQQHGTNSSYMENWNM